MKDCTQLDPLVTPYVDGELAVADRQAVDQHLRACPPCRARVAAEHTIRDLILAKKPALESARAPAGLRARCAAFGKLPAGHPNAGAALGTPGLARAAGASLLARPISSTVNKMQPRSHEDTKKEGYSS